jgi:SAM-dependent methyltransferase
MSGASWRGAKSGVAEVTEDDRARWEERYAQAPGPDKAPSAWIVDRARRLPNDGVVADVAGGAGRHALPILRSGRRVVLVDFIERAVRRARRADPALLGVVADSGAMPFTDGAFAGLVVTNFLDRGLFGEFARLLAPGGVLLYETYTRSHLELAALGQVHGPRSPRFALESGELPTLVRPLEVEEYEEGFVEDAAGARHVARVVALKPE